MEKTLNILLLIGAVLGAILGVINIDIDEPGAAFQVLPIGIGAGIGLVVALWVSILLSGVIKMFIHRPTIETISQDGQR